MPHFFIGTAICDIEFLKEWRPLDYARNVGIWWAVLRNTLLAIVVLTYGTVDKYGCWYTYD